MKFPETTMSKHALILVLHVLNAIQYLSCTDFTYSAFGSNNLDISPAAFGDFNSDELTDLFVINKNETGSIVKILLGSLKEPYFTQNLNLQCFMPTNVSSVVPGDFDGDGLMDVMVTGTPFGSVGNIRVQNVYVHWGEYVDENLLRCSEQELFQTYDEPLAITYQTDLRTDIFATNYEGTQRMKKGIFRLSRDDAKLLMNLTSERKAKYPHSHAFLDVNEDNSADLVLTMETCIDIWIYDEESNTFRYEYNISYPNNIHAMNADGIVELGQILFIDLESSDKLYIILPVIKDTSIWVYSFEFKKWFKLPISFVDADKKSWSFKYNDETSSSWISSWNPLPFTSKTGPAPRYMDIPTLRAGDFDNDGFVDLLATLRSDKQVKTFLFKNSPCVEFCEYSRTFVIEWTQLSPNNENAVMGVFFDFMQDGILDVIFVQRVENSGDDKYAVSAYKNSLDYDANFIKVMVISGIDNMSVQMPASSILGKKHFFGSNLPGPKIRYKTTNQDGIPQYGRTSQLAQSAHFALNLPYTIFGLGRSPNFVEDLIIGMFNETKQISPIIPNSQLVIRIPNTAAKNPSKWRAQLFVTPSKIIWQTVFALTGTCIVLAIVIGALHWKERREDKMERLQESQRFHFDAM